MLYLQPRRVAGMKSARLDAEASRSAPVQICRHVATPAARRSALRRQLFDIT